MPAPAYLLRRMLRCSPPWALRVCLITLFACERDAALAPPDAFDGGTAGEIREIGGIKTAWCPAGSFVMGSPLDEPERRPGEAQKRVTLTKGFWIAQFEATQRDWTRIVGALPGPLTDELPAGDDLPVGNMSFGEAEAFTHALTDLAHADLSLPTHWEFRLPTEAQWEYAARAGTTTATAFGDSLSSTQANFRGEHPYNGGAVGPSLGRAVAVGSYPPNGWNIYDMHGNIYEWCRDWYHIDYPGGADPDLHDAEKTATPNDTGARSRARRGGAWTDLGWPCRSAFRLRFEPERRYDHIGFRVGAVRK